MGKGIGSGCSFDSCFFCALRCFADDATVGTFTTLAKEVARVRALLTERVLTIPLSRLSRVDQWKCRLHGGVPPSLAPRLSALRRRADILSRGGLSFLSSFAPLNLLVCIREMCLTVE